LQSSTARRILAKLNVGVSIDIRICRTCWYIEEAKVRALLSGLNLVVNHIKQGYILELDSTTFATAVNNIHWNFGRTWDMYKKI
jgi:hypothetical protein